MRFESKLDHRAVILIAMICAGVSAAGCKHETPAQEAQHLQAQEDSDVAACQAEIRKVVGDPARADRLVSLVSEFQSLVHDTAAKMKEDRAKVALLDANYAATRADYEALFAAQDAQRQAFVQGALGLREQAAALLSDDEWKQLKDARIKAFDAELQELEY